MQKYDHFPSYVFLCWCTIISQDFSSYFTRLKLMHCMSHHVAWASKCHALSDDGHIISPQSTKYEDYQLIATLFIPQIIRK